MPPRKDQVIYDDVVAHPDIRYRAVEAVARRCALDVVDVRVCVHKSTRLRMVAPGLGWHVVELTPAEKEKMSEGADSA
jgi:predicted regulator of amino acid metabolism with ACT domain